MKQYRVMIVDDEPIAQRIIQQHCRQLLNLTVVNKSQNALEAMAFLQSNKVEIIFLDLNMPQLHGFEMLKAMQIEAQVIVTTAYSEYALDGYAFGICDYLLKPISFEKFVVATNKAIKNLLYKSQPELSHAFETSSDTIPAIDESIFIKADKLHHQVFLKDILFIMGCGNYCAVQLTDKKLMTYQKLAYFQESLPIEQFIRIHKSYVCAIDKIAKVGTKSLFVEEHELAIGHVYREGVLKLINSK